jgi:hypothetical protein
MTLYNDELRYLFSSSSMDRTEVSRGCGGVHVEL